MKLLLENIEVSLVEKYTQNILFAVKSQLKPGQKNCHQRHAKK